MPSRLNKQLRVKAGRGYVEAGALLDSTKAYSSRTAEILQERFAQDGYLFLRGFIPSRSVLQAHAHLLQQLHQEKPEIIALDGCCLSTTEGAGLLSRQDLAHSREVEAVLESRQLIYLASILLQEHEVKTTSYKWLRAVRPGDFTGLHTDRVFLGGGSNRLLTIWLPLQTVEPEQGGLLVCSGSHRSRGFSQLRATYGASSVGRDGTQSGWLTDDGSQLATYLPGKAGWVDWRTASFAPGDIVVLHQDVLHMTASNETDRFRLSCDTRWQPVSDSSNPILGAWKEFHAG